jgi:hypothetical protein
MAYGVLCLVRAWRVVSLSNAATLSPSLWSDELQGGD